MSITKHVDGRLFEAQELINKQTIRHAVDVSLINECQRRIAELAAAHTEALEMTCDAMEKNAELEEELKLNEETMGEFNLNEGRLTKENAELQKKIDSLENTARDQNRKLLSEYSTEYLARALSDCRYLLDRQEEVEKRNRKLSSALVEVREVWAGSDGLVPETCPEAYLQRIVIQCYDIAVEALKK